MCICLTSGLLSLEFPLRHKGCPARSHKSGRGGQEDIPHTLAGRAECSLGTARGCCNWLFSSLHTSFSASPGSAWCDPLATNHTCSVPGRCIPGGQEENEWLSVISFLTWGSEEDKNTRISNLAIEGPVVSSPCGKNKHLLSL